MNPILYFGQFLAKVLNQENKSGAICGFIRIALKDHFGEKGPDQITPASLKTALNGKFSEKLKKLHWDNLEDAVQKTCQEIDKNQSIFTMSKI